MDTNHSLPAPEANNADSAQQIRYLLQIVTGMALVTLIFGPAELVAGLLFNIPAFLLLSGITGLVFAFCFWSRVVLRRGQIQRGTIIFCSAVLLAILTIGLLLPFIMPALIPGSIIAVTIALTYLGRRAINGLMIAVMLIITLILVNGSFALIALPLEPPPQIAIDILLITVIPSILALNFLVLWQFASRLQVSLANARAANTTLTGIQATLEQQVHERTTELQAALTDVRATNEKQAELLATLESQQTTIRTLSVPVLPVSNDVLVLPLVGNLDDARLELLQQQALSAIERSSASHLLLDVTGVTVVDTHVAQGLIATIRSAQLLGTEAILVGIRPEVAQTIVGLGLSLEHIRTFRDVQGALAVLKN
jgi:rsbT co-antagonist protein RsbR